MPISAPETPKHATGGMPVQPWYSSATAVAALSYACLVALMWGAYNPHSGFPYETAFPYWSETVSAIRGFLYSDIMRIHTNTFYQLSYLLGELLGVRGSYVPYQVVFALLWWARGMLVFAILRKFLPGCPALCYCAGALVLVHSCDGATMWVGQMNQYGFIFWMLAAMYTFLWAWDASPWWKVVLLSGAAAFLEHMSLFSYESQILLILIFPVVCMVARRQWRKPLQMMAWYSMSGGYLALSYVRYLHSHGATYQESVMRKSWSLASLAGDWVFNIAASLKFWTWTGSEWHYPAGEAHFLSALAALVFAAGCVAVVRRGGEFGNDGDRANPFSASMRSCWGLLAGGFLALVLSFPVYLLLDASRNLWRTQILSGIGSGMVMAAALGLLSWLPLRKLGRLALVITAGAVITYHGSVSAIQKSGVHRWVWERHRTAVLEILRVAPDVVPGALVVLTNVPKDADPFGENIWFDLAIRLAYPGVRVAGTYFYSDGSRGVDNHLFLEAASWRWDGGGFGHLLSSTPIERTVVVRYDASGAGKLLEKLPLMVCNTDCVAASYHPTDVITSRQASPIAARRFELSRYP